MLPRSIEAFQFIESVFTVEQLDKYGNILGPVLGQGWSNHYSSFYTQLPPNEYDVEPGDQAPEYWVTGYDVSGAPLWNQPDLVTSIYDPETGLVSYIRSPKEVSSLPPPIGNIEPIVPPPSPVVYNLTVNPTDAGPGEVFSSTVTAVDGQVDLAAETLYWRYEGSGIKPSYFTNNSLTGSIVLTNDTGGWSSTVAYPIPSGLTFKIHVYEDPSYYQRVATANMEIRQSGYTITTSPNPVTGGQTLTTTVTTIDVPSGSTLYWSLSGVPSSYFKDEAMEGQLQTSGDTGVFLKELADEIADDGTLTITLYNDSARKVQVKQATTKIDGTPVYGLSTNPTVVKESNQIVNTFTATHTDDGTVFYWKYLDVDGSYFLGDENEGQITINNGFARWSSITVANLPGDGTAIVKVFTDPSHNNQVGNSTTFEIKKTLIPTYSLSENPTTVVGGDTLGSTLSTTYVPNGTELYWQYSGTNLTPAFFTDNKLDGNITVNNDIASWTSTFVETIPASLTMSVKVYESSSRVKLLASANVQVNRTPVPVYNLSVSPNVVTDGQTFTSSLTTEDVQSGTVLYWEYENVDGSYFTDGKNIGQITVQNRSASWASTTVNPLPSGITVPISLYTDSARQNKVATTTLQINKTPVTTYTWSTQQTQVTDAGSVFYNITAEPAPTINHTIYYKITGITSDYLGGTSTLTGSIPWGIGEGSKTLTIRMADVLPDNATMQNRLYSDPQFQTYIVPIISVDVVKTPVPSYAVSVSPSPASAGDVITSTATTTNLPPNSTIYWSYSGTGITPAYFTDGILQGIVSTNNQGQASWSSTLTNPLPSDTTLVVSLFADSQRQTVVASKSVAIANGTPTYSLVTVPATANDGDVISNLVTTTHVDDGTVLHWQYRGNIDRSFFTDGKELGTITIKNNTANWKSTLENPVPRDATMTVNLFKRSLGKDPVGNIETVNIQRQVTNSGYLLSTSHPTAGVGQTITFTIKIPTAATTTETYHWRIQGLDPFKSWFTENVKIGTITVQAGQDRASWSRTVLNTLDYGGMYQVEVANDPEFTDPVMPPIISSICPSGLENGVYFSTTAIAQGDALSIRVVDGTKTGGETLYWEFSGNNVVAGLFEDNTLSGSATFGSDGQLSILVATSNPLPSAGPFNVTMQFYSDSGKTQPVYNVGGAKFLIYSTTPSTPLLQIGSNIDEYYGLGGYWTTVNGVPTPNNVGDNPDLNMGEVMPYRDNLDEFLLRTKMTVGGDGKLRMIDGIDSSPTSDGLVLNSTNDGWNPSAGNDLGEGGQPNSAAKAKACLYHVQNSFTPTKYFIQFGGDLGEGNDIFDGSTCLGGLRNIHNLSPSQKTALAGYIHTLVGLAGNLCKGVEFAYYIPKDQVDTASIYAEGFKPVYDQLKVLDSNLIVGVSFNARFDNEPTGQDSANTPDIASRFYNCSDYITIRNYENISKYGQFPDDSNNVFYHSSNPYWAFSEVYDYVSQAQALSPSKLATTISLQGMLTYNTPTSNTVATYGDILRSIDTDGFTKVDAVMGRFNGGVDLPDSTTVTGNWGFDSTSYVYQKVQGTINMGMSRIVLNSLGGDYYTSTTQYPGTARAQMAILRATRVAISGESRSISYTLQTTPAEITENIQITNTLSVEGNFLDGTTYYYQYEYQDPTDQAWKVIPNGYLSTALSGSVTVSQGGATWTSNSETTLPGNLVARVAVYITQPSTTPTINPVVTSQISFKKAVGPSYSVSCAPSAVNDGDSFVATVNTTNVTTGTTLFWSLTGTNVTPDMFAGGATTGSIVVAETGSTPFTVKMAPVLPNDATIDVNISTTQGGAAVAVSQVVATKSTPTQHTYAFSIDKAFVSPGDTFEVKAIDTSSNSNGTGDTLYWKLEGFDGATFLTDSSTQGSFVVGSDGVASLTKTVQSSLGNGCIMKATLYSDSGHTQPIAPAFSTVILQSDYGIDPFTQVNPAAANSSSIITYRTKGVVNEGDQIRLTPSGTAVTAGIIAPDVINATAGPGGEYIHQWVVPANLPTQSYSYNLVITSERATGTEFDNEMQVTITESVPSTDLKSGCYVDIYQWRLHGADNSGGTAEPTYDQMKAVGVPQLDEFYLLGEIVLYSDGKVYFAHNADGQQGQPVIRPEALLLNGDATNWNPNDTSFDDGPKLVKGASQQIVSDLKPRKYILSVGGYNQSNEMTEAGSTDALATQSADQLFALANLAGANAIDLDYEPLTGWNGSPTTLDPSAIARLCQKLRQKITQNNSNLEIELTLVPTLDAADSFKRIASAVACVPYVDRINVMTYDNPTSYGQPYKDQTLVQSHTGVYQSVLDVQRFIDAGVPHEKLGMGIASYGRNVQNPFSSNPPPRSFNELFTYEGAGDWPLGRIVSLAPGDGNALFSIDSLSTVTQKVTAARLMGLAGVFQWQITQDYWTGEPNTPAGNTRAAMALTRATRIAISGSEY